jgi:hypothetical protein
MNQEMDPRDEPSLDELAPLIAAFRDQLIACLEECAHGRHGLFSSAAAETGEHAWPEAARLRELAIALQAILAQAAEEQAEAHGGNLDRVLIEEFLDLCTIHGESDPGERRLARAFLDRMEKGEVGVQPEQEKRPW